MLNQFHTTQVHVLVKQGRPNSRANLTCHVHACLAAQAHRYRQSLRAVLQAWQEYVQHKRRKRQLLLRAEACYVFMTLLRVLQQWRAHTTDQQVARLRAARWGCCPHTWCLLPSQLVLIFRQVGLSLV